MSTVTMGMLSASESRLAIAGGDPIVSRGHVLRSVWPRLDNTDVERILTQVRSGLLTEMSATHLVHEFEAEIAAAVGTRYALTTNSGTAALHCAIAGLGIGPGDEVIIPALTYVACAAAVLHQNAIPVFADVDPRTFNLTPASVAAAVSDRTRAVMVVHLHGLPVDVASIRESLQGRDIAIIEDFAQAFGAALDGKPVGSLGEVGCASLMAGKNLPAAGEGGVLVTNDRTIRNRAASLKCFGEAVGSDGTYHLLHETAGYNYRISLLPMALASQQLFRLEEFNRARQFGAMELDRTLLEIPGFTPPFVPSGACHVYHMYRFRFDPRVAGLAISADQGREGLKQVFWAEGLPLVEFQNAPIPGHALIQGKVGYGRGCPWKCQGRDDITYRIEDYPAALDVIRHSLVIGMPSQAPLANQEVVEAYCRCFRKIRQNLRSFERFASGLNACAPWQGPPRLF